MCDVSVAVWSSILVYNVLYMESGDTPGIRLSPSLGWLGGPPTKLQPKQRQKQHSVLALSIWCPIIIVLYARTLFKLSGHSESSLNGPHLPPFSVLDRLLTRLSALYCQRSRVRRRFCWKIQAFYSWRKLLSRCRYKPLKSKTIPRMTPIIRLHELIFSDNAGLIQKISKRGSFSDGGTTAL